MQNQVQNIVAIYIMAIELIDPDTEEIFFDVDETKNLTKWILMSPYTITEFPYGIV